jgi:exopolysaccharide biosynthesis polyprenyl glycosylphosphotransferase
MKNRGETLVLVVTDIITSSIAWTIFYLFRVRSGLFDVNAVPDFWVPMIAVCVLWFLLFFIVGLYRPWYAASRLDELALLFKAISVGSLILFFVIFIDDAGKPTGTSSRVLIAIYWADVLVMVSAGRMVLRSIQRRMLIAGIGVHNTLIVGSAARSRELYNEVVKYPGLGYRVVGLVGVDRRRAGKQHRRVPVMGGIDDLHEVIGRNGIREVLIALDSSDHGRLLDIIAKCNGHRIGLKIMPDLYDIISGQARTNQIYGFPLIEITPQLMPPWEESTKRLIDIGAAILILGAGLPLWLLVAIVIKLDSPGPVLYRQERVGKDGVSFDIIKFRSMGKDAELEGPRWAGRQDPRITRFGRIIRQLHVDEIPQMINVLKGDMSLIGPRPERTVFVQRLSKEIPLYQRRLKVRPGITGWAQVKQKYDETIDDVKKKVQYDLFYIENMSLRMDFKILLNTAYHILLGRGR